MLKEKFAYVKVQRRQELELVTVGNWQKDIWQWSFVQNFAVDFQLIKKEKMMGREKEKEYDIGTFLFQPFKLLFFLFLSMFFYPWTNAMCHESNWLFKLDTIQSPVCKDEK